MHFIRRPSWALKESAVTPEHLALNRRGFLRGAAALSATAIPGAAAAQGNFLGKLFGQADVSQYLDFPPFEPKPALNPEYADAGREVTAERINATYNNFYEFGTSKTIYAEAQVLPTDGWTVTIDGMVEEAKTIAIEDLLKAVQIEERVVRHRCVEGWSMVAPWIGFPITELNKLVKPLSGAKYLRFESFDKPEVASGQRSRTSPWPYTEGVTIEEAQNELSFLVVGAYGKVLHKQFGAPIRLHLPWKYGFKSIKSIERITFTDERPVSYWEELQAREYGFWANVNPEVAHPRWSQATERVIGEVEQRIPTVIYNGYGEQVASLYAGLEAKYADRLWR
ncbi:MAG: protein-methionine-sulfoxide reductase catalytic subunit MsrP [Pseudomonadota bacterium]